MAGEKLCNGAASGAHSVREKRSGNYYHWNLWWQRDYPFSVSELQETIITLPSCFLFRRTPIPKDLDLGEVINQRPPWPTPAHDVRKAFNSDKKREEKKEKRRQGVGTIRVRESNWPSRWFQIRLRFRLSQAKNDIPRRAWAAMKHGGCSLIVRWETRCLRPNKLLTHCWRNWSATVSNET